MKYIGEKKIKDVTDLDQTTPGGVPLVEVVFKDGTKEVLSKLMYDQVVSEKSVGLSDLRDQRLDIVVREVLSLMRDWGVKVGELQHFSSLLNQSLDYNTNTATRELWSQYMPKPASLDEVDLVTIDRVLRDANISINDVLDNPTNS